MLEPAGPSIVISGLDRRIPAGEYDIEHYSSKKYPDNFILSNEDVPKSRRVLFHPGNTGDQTLGCIMPGCNLINEGEIGDSRAKFIQLRNWIKTRNGPVKLLISDIPAQIKCFFWKP